MTPHSLQVTTHLRNLAVLLLCAFLGVGQAGATSQTLTGVGGPAAATGCTAATNFLARTSGLSGTETTAYRNLICGLVTDGIITGTMSGSGSGASACGSALDGLYILASNTTTTAKLNLCSTSYGLVYNGVPSEATQFSADHGYTGNAANVYLNTQFNASTATTPNYALNSASFGIYVLTNRTVAANKADIGAQAPNFSFISPFDASGSAFTADVNATSFPAGASQTTAQGFSAVSRTGSTGFSQYKNASSTPLISPSSTSVSVQNDNFVLFNFGAAGTSWSDDQISAAFIGAGLTGAQYLALSNRINAYMTALGINVY